MLHAEGAREVYACATHAVFSPPATKRLSGGVFQEVIVTNTIPVASELQFPCLTVLSVRLPSPAVSAPWLQFSLRTSVVVAKRSGALRLLLSSS